MMADCPASFNLYADRSRASSSTVEQRAFNPLVQGSRPWGRTGRVFTMLLHLPPMDGHGEQPRVKNGPPLAGQGAEAARNEIARVIATLHEQLRRSLTPTLSYQSRDAVRFRSAWPNLKPGVPQDWRVPVGRLMISQGSH
jgi:hypothetical protein